MLATTISGVVSVDDIWGDEWDILLVSLQVGLEFNILCSLPPVKLWQRARITPLVFFTNSTLGQCVFVVSFQSTAPFLHIGALTTVTALSWLVAGYVVRRERSSKCVSNVLNWGQILQKHHLTFHLIPRRWVGIQWSSGCLYSTSKTLLYFDNAPHGGVSYVFPVTVQIFPHFADCCYLLGIVNPLL